MIAAAFCAFLSIACPEVVSREMVALPNVSVEYPPPVYCVAAVDGRTGERIIIQDNLDLATFIVLRNRLLAEKYSEGELICPPTN